MKQVGAGLLQAARLGEEVIELEAWIDRLFASGEVDSEVLSEFLLTAASGRAELRPAHLVAHTEMRPILFERQRSAYMSSRGYRSRAVHRHGDNQDHDRHDRAAA